MKDTMDRFSSIIGKSSEILVVITLCLYISGFLITSIYLASYNVVSVELIKGRYILVGAVFISFFISTIIGGLLIGDFLTGRYKSRKKIELGLGVITGLIISLFFAFISAGVVLIIMLLTVHVGDKTLLMQDIDLKQLSKKIFEFHIILDIILKTVFYAAYALILGLTFGALKSLAKYVWRNKGFKGFKKELFNIFSSWRDSYKDFWSKFIKENLRIFYVLFVGAIGSVTIASLIPDSLKTLNYSGIIFKRLFLFALLVSGVLSIFLFTVHPLRDETLKERGQDQQNEFSVIGTLWRIKIISPFVIALLVINIWFYSNFVFPLLPVEMGDRKSILN